MGYVVGRPVSGSDFYGRKELLKRIYEGPEWATWIIGGRRMGKTSVLHQIRHRAGSDPRKVALFCNWHPANGVSSLKDILMTSVQDPENYVTDKLNISEAAIEGLPFFDALQHLVWQARQQKLQVLLLIDEPEDVLLTLAASDPFSMKRLHSSMLQSKALHTVIASGPRLRALYDLAWKTSPFWEGFEQLYIGPLEWDEAVSLIRQTQSNKPKMVPDKVASSILERTGQIPWLIQSVCQATEPYNEESEVPDTIWSTREYDDRFTTDYKALLEEERRVLRSVGRYREPLNVNDIVSDCDILEGQVLQALERLQKLGYVKQSHPGFYGISNLFLNEYLVLELWKTIEHLAPDTLSQTMGPGTAIQSSSRQRLSQHRDELQSRWDELTAHIVAVQRDRGSETDGERRHTLQGRLEKLKAERDQVEAKLNTLEQQLE